MTEQQRTADRAEPGWSQRDLGCAQAVLGSAAEPGFSLPTLTDEEVVALDGVDRDQFVALPWLDGHRDQLELVCNVALRTLLSKGIAFPVIYEGQSEPSGLAARDDITGVMALRRLGQRIITAQLSKADGDAWLYGYIHGEQVLEELVDPAGTHTFSVSARADFPESIMQLANFASVSSAVEESRQLSVGEYEVLAPKLLADTLGMTVVAGISAGQEAPDGYTLLASAQSLHGLKAVSRDGESLLELAAISRETGLAELHHIVGQGGAA